LQNFKQYNDCEVTLVPIPKTGSYYHFKRNMKDHSLWLGNCFWLFLNSLFHSVISENLIVPVLIILIGVGHVLVNAVFEFVVEHVMRSRMIDCCTNNINTVRIWKMLKLIMRAYYKILT
jgi:hypothetical protein